MVVLRSFHGPRYPGLFLHIGLAWFLAPFLIRVLPLPHLLKVYSPRRRFPRDEERFQRIPRYLEVVQQLFPMGKAQHCLRRCLVLFYFLNRWGEPVAIRFGFQTAGPRGARGHSWLTRSDDSLWERDSIKPGFSEVAVFHWGQETLQPIGGES